MAILHITFRLLIVNTMRVFTYYMMSQNNQNILIIYDMYSLNQLCLILMNTSIFTEINWKPDGCDQVGPIYYAPIPS